MNTLSGLHPVYKPKDPSRRYKGIAIVVALHIVIGWGIVSGTARNALVALKKPLEAVVIQEVIIPPPPPPPPPPPKQIQPKEAPKVDAPPPPFVPPPDVPPPATATAPVVQSVATPPPPAPAVIAPPAPPPPPAPPKPAPNRSDIRVACPTQVAPEMPRKAIQDGTEGVVKAQALIKEGAVKEVTILSGPRVFHAAVKAAMMQYKCTADGTEILAIQEFVFKIE
jgi:protein TonB